MKLTTRTPDWTDHYANERRRAAWRKAGDFLTNFFLVLGVLTFFYVAMTLCSILEPVRW